MAILMISCNLVVLGETLNQNRGGFGCALPPFVDGQMHINEQGQMCGPYIQQQLYESLSIDYYQMSFLCIL